MVLEVKFKSGSNKIEEIFDYYDYAPDFPISINMDYDDGEFSWIDIYVGY